MAMDKAIEHGKEHRKPWRGSDRSKNFDKTCRNHGSCDYCKFNRLHTFMKNRAAVDDRLKEWRKNMRYFVTYFLLFKDGSTKELIEKFNYFPSQRDINEVGGELVADYNAISFCSSRGKNGINGWEEYE